MQLQRNHLIINNSPTLKEKEKKTKNTLAATKKKNLRLVYALQATHERK